VVTWPDGEIHFLVATTALNAAEPARIAASIEWPGPEPGGASAPGSAPRRGRWGPVPSLGDQGHVGPHGRREREREIARVLDLVDLTEHAGRKVRGYSGGMRRRIGIAQALLGEPPLLVVDEPTAGMDLDSRLQLRDVLRRVSAGRIVLLSTHLISDIDALAHRLLFLHGGRLRYDGPQSAFREAGRGHVGELVVAQEEADALAERFHVTRRVHVADGVELRLLAVDGSPLPAPAVEPTLEESYLVHLHRARVDSESKDAEDLSRPGPRAD